jgi:hypothetical protein
MTMIRRRRLKDKWCSRLRNTDYLKSVGQLYTPSFEAYSAIGILCLLYMEELNAGHFTQNGAFVDAEGNALRSGAPLDVLEWAQIEDRGHGINLGRGLKGRTVVALNDGLNNVEEQNFFEIADLIERHL